MIALILAAGYGTRMVPLTEKTPKALLPVAGRPILAHLLDRILVPSADIEEIVLVSNSRFAEQFRRWFQSANLAVPWRVLDDGSTSEADRLGSVGDLAFAVRACGPEKEFLVGGSDNLFEEPADGFLSFARRCGCITLGAYLLADDELASRYGVLSIGPDGRITAFVEKPKDPPSRLVSTAIYFFPRTAVPRVLEYVSSRETADTLGSFISWLIVREPVFAYRFRGAWFDIGDVTSYRNAQESFRP